MVATVGQAGLVQMLGKLSFAEKTSLYQSLRETHLAVVAALGDEGDRYSFVYL